MTTPQAIEKALREELTKAIKTNTARQWFKCGGDKVRHRSRTTAEKCRFAEATITMIREIPGAAQYDDLANVHQLVKSIEGRWS